jgi:DDE superfamily endonuclease
MLTLPQEMMNVILPFVALFSETVWDYAQILLMGVILAPGKRTVSATLTVLGLKDDPQYQNYHRVLNRAKWCGLTASKILFGLLVQAFVAAGAPIILGADETLERRKGKQIKQKGVFRDPIRSSKKYLVHSFGLRWISMMLIVPVPWSNRPWALPFLTLNAPSEATNKANGKRHKTSIDLIRQMICLVRRWLRNRVLVLVTDGGLAAVKMGLTCGALRQPVIWVSRMRLDAGLYAWPGKQPKSKPSPKPQKGKRLKSLNDHLHNPHTQWQKTEIDWYGGRKYTIEYVTGKALWYTPGFNPLPIRWVLVRDPAGKYDATAFLCTDLTTGALQILAWFILRWNVEVTFQESRALLGLETQRQWSDLAIARTTPTLLGVFSLVALIAHQLTKGKPFPTRSSAWYTKKEPTFSDALAVVRHHIWFGLWGEYIESTSNPDYVLIPTSIFSGLVDSMCYTT